MLSPLVSRLLARRGFTDEAAIEAFLKPDYYRGVHDPFLLKDAEKAATRILGAVAANERVAIYADYDADGIPGAAMWSDFLRRIGYANFRIYIPHRHDEGFGLNDAAIDELAADGVKLVVTLDCGISDVKPVARANEKGMEVIITDHHEPPLELPRAYAIIDHKQADCLYPDKNLCGTGVGYKLIQAIIKKARELGAPLSLKEGHEKWLLDLVGIATMSDMVPLVGENRIFAHYGMTVLRKSPRKGLIRLLAKLKIDQRYLSEDDIAFMITPRINAASRMGAPMDAFHMLAAETEEEAASYVDHLDAINNERKGIVAALVKEVKKTLRERYGDSAPAAIVMGNPDWRPSLLGLVANSCAEEFGRPVFLWGRDGSDALKGSCRSEGSSSVVDIMRGVPEGVFVKYGGHKHSGGFEVGDDQVHFLEKHIVASAERESVARHASSSSAGAGIDCAALGIDEELFIDDVDHRLYEGISQLSPFGTGNPKPKFLFRGVKPLSVRRFGKGEDHIEFIFQKNLGSKLSAIAFFGAASPWAERALAGDTMDLVASVEKSFFRGRPELRLRVEDVIYS